MFAAVGLSRWSCFGGIPELKSLSGRVSKVHALGEVFYLKECSSVDHAQRETDLLRFLAGAGLPVPDPIPCADGTTYAHENGKPYWLSRALPGEHLDQFRGPVGLDSAECLASALAKLHRALALAPYPESFPLLVDSSNELMQSLLARKTPFDVRRLTRLLSQCVLAASLPQQLIHRDPHRLNMLFSDGAVTGYLDFELVQRAPKLFDVCYCASGALSESFSIAGYPEYWLGVLERVFRVYKRQNGLSSTEHSAAWNMFVTIQLIFMSYCLENNNVDVALTNESMLYWYEDHRFEIEAAVAA